MLKTLISKKNSYEDALMNLGSMNVLEEYRESYHEWLITNIKGIDIVLNKYNNQFTEFFKGAQ